MKYPPVIDENPYSDITKYARFPQDKTSVWYPDACFIEQNTSTDPLYGVAGQIV
jgi:hypothetical protein